MTGSFQKDEEVLTLEKGAFRPFVKGKQVQRYTPLESKLFILFPYIENANGDVTVMPEEFIADYYPKVYTYLKSVEQVHREKRRRSTNDDGWYRYARNQGLKHAGEEKILMEIASGFPNATLNNSGCFFTLLRFTAGSKNQL